MNTFFPDASRNLAESNWLEYCHGKALAQFREKASVYQRFGIESFHLQQKHHIFGYDFPSRPTVGDF